jgi:ATP-dependent RNA helicase MSS116
VSLPCQQSSRAQADISSVAQAKTGTGKTLGFLVPLVHRILAATPELAARQRPQFGMAKGFGSSGSDVRAIIISPTRELAEQIANEARKLTRRTGIKVQLAVGGNSKSQDLRRVHQEGCHIMVGTPGRLADVLSDPHSGVSAPNMQTIVLDEADRLLEAGFASEIETIQASLPDPEQVPRQNLMYSATISHDVVDLVQQILRPGFEFAQCVDPNEEPTHQRVDQRLVVLPSIAHETPALLELIQREVEKSASGEAPPFKAMVFFNSIAEVVAMNSMLWRISKQLAPGTEMMTIHSRLSQNQRTGVAQSFRRAKSAILVTTDVTARGMDFPDVTHVIQMDLPNTRPTEYYIHRLGRTARAGKAGQGWLFVTNSRVAETRKTLGSMPLKVDQSLQSATESLSGSSTTLPGQVADVLSMAQRAFSASHPSELQELYTNVMRKSDRLSYREKDRYIQDVHNMVRSVWGLESPPAISSQTASKLGLNEGHGVVISTGREHSARPSFGGGFRHQEGGDRWNKSSGRSDGLSGLRDAMGGGGQRGDRNGRGGRGGRGGRESNSSLGKPSRRW